MKAKRKVAAVPVVTAERDGHHSQQLPNFDKEGGLIALYQASAYAKRVSFCIAQGGSYTPGR
jgi:hypothetical protein